MSSDNESHLEFWCHVCNVEVSASMDAEVGEYQCTSCHGSFVEHLGQQLENFIAQPVTSQSPDHDDMPPLEGPDSTTNEDLRGVTAVGGGELGNFLIQRIVNRILGLGVQTRPSVQSTLLTVLQQAALESGRPVGIVVRQTTTARELALLTSLLGMGRGVSAEVGGNGSPDFASLIGAAMGGGIGGEGRGFEDLLHHIMMNESSHAGAPPATDEVIQTLHRQVVSYHQEQPRLGVCCISQEPFEEGDVAVTLPCSHSYKEAPIVQWLRRHNSCPVCRYAITTDPSPSPATNTH